MKFAVPIPTILGSLLLLLANSANLVSADCSDVHVVFARGSGEMAGLGICGEPLVSGITSDLSGMSVSSYAGASVTDIAIGIKTTLGSGDTIPDTLASRIKAIVTFGNPLKLMGETVASASSTYGSKAIEFCNQGDPVCGNGANTMAHLTYPTDGSVTSAAEKAAALVKGGSRTLRG
ncbi:hypothetical protein PI125_g1705 [Phytophthora idaei]|nr:hypothetical protein PI125_g1705 [Phytophthora idaei]